MPSSGVPGAQASHSSLTGISLELGMCPGVLEALYHLYSGLAVRVESQLSPKGVEACLDGKLEL